MRKANENYLAAASANFLDRASHVGKTLFDSFLHSLKKDIFGNVRRGRRRREKRRPDLLNFFRQWTSWLRALLPHARPAFAIFRLEIRRKSWRHDRTGTIRDGQLIEESVKTQIIGLQERDMLFERHREIFADALSWRLVVITLHTLFGALHRR